MSVATVRHLCGQDYAWLCKRARRRVRSDSFGDEIAHEAIAAMIRSGDRFTDGSNFRGWASVVLDGVIVDHYRRSATHPQHHEHTLRIRGNDDDFDSIGAVQRGLYVLPPQIDSIILDEHYRRFLTLPPRYFRTACSVFLTDLPLADIAAKLHIPLGTVKRESTYARYAINRPRNMPEYAATFCLRLRQAYSAENAAYLRKFLEQNADVNA